MKRLIVLGAMLASLAGVARGEDPRPTVFVRVDAVRIEHPGLVVVGETLDGDIVEWKGDFRETNVSLADLSVPEAYQACIRVALHAMDHQGDYRLELANPPRAHPGCALVKVRAPPQAESAAKRP